MPLAVTLYHVPNMPARTATGGLTRRLSIVALVDLLLPLSTTAKPDGNTHLERRHDN
jgi:hypothetical protein